MRDVVTSGHGPFDNLLWQAIVGAWPASRERLHAYAEKAAREAGEATGWLAPEATFEASMHAVVDAAFDDPRVAERLASFVASIEQFGWSNSLGAKLIQLTAPGVPDVYQGSELWEQSLVDPDNRRAVDFARAPRTARPPRRRVAAGCRRLGRREAAGHLPRPAAAPRSPGALHPLRADDRHRERRATT